MKKIIIITGATATGKTDYALDLAKKKPINIINMDSVLVYRGLNIGSAKPNSKILKKIKHYLVDIINPNDSFNVATFCKLAKEHVDETLATGKIPVFVGGTMLYLNALLHGLSDLPKSSKIIRQELDEYIAKNSLESLHQTLLGFDKPMHSKLHPNDKQRIIRAVEVYKLTKTPLSQLQNKRNLVFDKSYTINTFALMPKNKQELDEIINNRFLKMLKQGLIDEVLELKNKYNLTAQDQSMQSVGYKQVFSFLENKITKEQMIEQAQAATRQLAKRQLTWLRSFDFITKI